MLTNVFKNFSDFWRFIKILNYDQRKILFDSLSRKEQKMLEESYQEGGWAELFMKNLIDGIVDSIRRDTKCDLFNIRVKVNKGEVLLMKKGLWREVQKRFEQFPTDTLDYVFGGITINEHNDEWMRLEPSSSMSESE